MRIGILGGTFDPIHLGHLMLAEQARETLSLDRVLVMPAARPPHKPEVPISAYEHRLAMVELALAGAEPLRASDFEREDDRPSFTVETLRRLTASAPEDRFVLLLGSDSLRDLPGWREPREISRLAELAVYPRPGEEESLISEGERVTTGGDDPITARLLEGPRLRLSSTEVRARVRAGRSIRFLVPPAVARYIQAHGLYRSDPDQQ
ncbi:MAG: nicotinate (nicotinamide) nucleotide adenylyltransferase [Candidatus Eisenbacteria bacterium]|nr:nicotinate (nicotinamide) nucleotide adenylyltransferase [Candidatus Eisenbacteria bacterium]